MKNSRAATVVLTAFVALMWPLVACANPISTEFVPHAWARAPGKVTFVLLAAFVVEWLFIRILFGRNVPVRRLLPAFVVINLITFPLTWLLSLGGGYFAEILPLSVEPYMYNAYFTRIQVAPQYTAPKVIIANLASFAFAMIVFHA